MSWLGSLFGTKKAVDNILDKDNGLLVRAGTALGNLHHSEQEKAEWGIRVLDSLTPFKIVQRVLAFAAMFLWVFIGINLTVAIWIQAVTSVTVVVDGVSTTTSINAVDALSNLAMSDYIFYPVMAIFVLYTGGGTLNSLKGNK
jgi:hypothetical protein